MLLQKDFLNKLKNFGLNNYEAKLWTALLSRGSSTAGDLSNIASVPRSRTYDVLESLEKKGFVIAKLEKPIKYIAVSPTEAYERVKRSIQEDTDSRIKVLDELRNSTVIDELTSLHVKGIEKVQPEDLTGSLKGRDNLYSHIDSLIKTAEKSVVIATTAKGFARKIERFRKSLDKAAKRGVEVKIIAPITKDNKMIVETASQFSEVKDADMGSRFIIFDENQVVFMLSDDEKVHPSYDCAVWVTTSFFAKSLMSFFESHWNSSRKITVKTIKV